MKKKVAVFPGSFDPITLGHVDIVERGAKLFDELIIAIGVNTEKKYMFSLEQRVEMIQKTFIDISNVSVQTYTGLTIDFCKEVGAPYILRGLRNANDFEFENAIAQTNKKLSGVETVLLLTSSDKSYISSSIVRDLIKHGGDISALAPQGVIQKL